MIDEAAANGLFDASSLFGGVILAAQSTTVELQALSLLISSGGLYRAVNGGYDQFEDDE